MYTQSVAAKFVSTNCFMQENVKHYDIILRHTHYCMASRCTGWSI